MSAMTGGQSHSYFPQPQRPITVRDLAVGVGATLAFFFTVLVVPMMGIFASILTPLPTLLGFYRWGRPNGYWIPFGTLSIGCVVLAATGLLGSVLYLVELLLLGILTAKGMRRQWDIARIVGWASVSVFALGSVFFWVSHGGFQGDLFAGLEKEVHLAMAALIQQYGPQNAQMIAVEKSLESVVPLVVRLLPGLAAASILLIAWLNLLLARHLCRVQRVALPAWPAWSHWKSPELMVWPLIGAGLLVVTSAHPWQLVGLNLLIVLGSVYLLHGLAVVAFYFERWRLPGMLRGLGYGLIFLQQLVSLTVMVLGLFDLWLDFRHLTKKSVSDASP